MLSKERLDAISLDVIELEGWSGSYLTDESIAANILIDLQVVGPAGTYILPAKGRLHLRAGHR